jgi:thiol-disulfide isomerase/thioredoxin
MQTRHLAAVALLGLFMAIAAGCGGSGSGTRSSAATVAAPKADAAAPAAAPMPAGDKGIVLKDLSGHDVALSSFQGKVVILNFLATWCMPCRGEIPDLVALQAEHPNDLAVVGILVLDPVSERTLPFVQQMKMSYTVLDGNDRKDLEETYGPFAGLPTSIILDRRGAIVARRLGATTKSDFAGAIAPLL